MSDTAGSPNGSREDVSVDRLLLEAGLDDDGGLRRVLLELHALAAEQPVPSDAVAALMMPAVKQTSDQRAATRHLAVVPATAAVPGTAVVPQFPETVASPRSEPVVAPAGDPAVATDELAARRRARRRITLTTLSVAVSLATGGAVAVASDQGIRDSIGQVNQAVTSFVSTGGGRPAPAPVETPAPGPVQPGVPAVGPTGPAVTVPVPAAPGSGSGQATQHAPAPSGSAPAVPLPDLPLPENVTPGAPGGPLNGEGQPPALPLPPTPPVPLPGVHP
ncbi:hypothetical protein DQ354_11025 [Arthrobacter sp. AQ5-06]|nr:hypothetical protein DQ354_11025 [Arthrobacter sp. AQ5-06]